MKLSQVAALLSQGSVPGVGVINCQLHGDCHFTSISTDTRTLAAGDLFVALSGNNFDANQFVPIAKQAGSKGFVVSRYQEGLDAAQLVVIDTQKALAAIAYAFRSGFGGKVSAITGSVGKTTVKGLLRSICHQAGSVIATHGNLNNHIGVPLTLARLDSEPQANYAVIEAGASGPDEICYLTGLIQPHVAIVNNVMPAHIEGFGSLAGVAHEKSRIYLQYGDAPPVAVINLDDDFAEQFLVLCKGSKSIGFSCGENLASNTEVHTSVFSLNESMDSTGCASFTLCIQKKGHTKPQSCAVSLEVFGQHNIGNALAAAACALGMGISLDNIVKGLESYRGEAGRLQKYRGIFGSTVVDDTYNANPGSMTSAITFLSQFSNTLLVCGDMGELGGNEESIHRDVGVFAKAQGVSACYSVGQYAEFVVEGFGEGGLSFSSQESLITHLKNIMTEKYITLVKGSRSARMENIVRAIKQEEVI